MKKLIIAACLLCTPAVAYARTADCLFVANGNTVFDGPCEFDPLPANQDIKKGSFQITAGDYFAVVNVDRKGSALGFYNEFAGSQQPSGQLGRLTPNGACWGNSKSKVCAWKPGERPGHPKVEKKSANQPFKPANPSQFTVTAPQIWRDYYSNEVAASKKYEDAIFTVTGTVLGVRYGRNNLVYAELNSSPTGDNVFAYFAKEATATAESLKRGQEVSLVCFGAAKLTEIDLIGCR